MHSIKTKQNKKKQKQKKKKTGQMRRVPEYNPENSHDRNVFWLLQVATNTHESINDF